MSDGCVDGITVGDVDGAEVVHSVQEHEANVGLNHELLTPSKASVVGQNPVDVPSMNSYQNISCGGLPE